MRSLLVLLAILVVALPAMATDQETISNSPGPVFGPHQPGDFQGPRDVLYDNGPILNFPPDQSMLQDASLGMSTYGFGMQISAGNIVADDFVSGAAWNIESFQFYGYQTGSSTQSTINDFRVELLDGEPDLPSTQVIWGDLTTNVLTSSVFSGIYRTLESAPGATNRPIMLNTVNAVFALPAGHYWLAWQAGGTLSSGPWANPIAIWNLCETGDGWQYTSAGGWAYVADGGGCMQGFPFIVNGTAGQIPVDNSSWGAIKHMYR